MGVWVLVHRIGNRSLYSAKHTHRHSGVKLESGAVIKIKLKLEGVLSDTRPSKIFTQILTCHISPSYVESF